MAPHFGRYDDPSEIIDLARDAVRHCSPSLSRRWEPTRPYEPEVYPPRLMWVDTHCHLQMTDPQILDRASDVDWVLVPGIDAASSRQAQSLSIGDPDRVSWSAGLHPHDAEKWPEQREELSVLAADAAAVGEIGLDFYRNLSSREAQVEAFRDQLALAEQLDKPAIVHCRDAFSDVFETVGSLGDPTRVVLHCWTGGPKWSKRFAELGVTFSFAGPVAFETGDTVRRGAAVLDPSTVMVETDTPYLSPPPFRGEPNEPARVALVGEALASVWGLDVADVARSTSARAARVFR